MPKMTSSARLLSFENPIFRGYLTHASILALKMMIVSLLTIRQRLKYGLSASSEDVKFVSGIGVVRHENIERIRRAHRNDMENILIFFVVFMTYLLTDPSPALALNLLRIFTVSRCLHTFVYAVYVIPQPARGLAWFGGFLVTGYMALTSILHFSTF